MSAICGIVRFDGTDITEGIAGRMAQAMRDRGADGIAHVDIGRLALGYCSMHVNREDVYEAQPIVERDAILIADIRLDNRDALAATFEIVPSDLAIMPDSDILLLAWRRWGDDCASHLIGDFAFAIWDRGDGSLLLGRDHMGQRVVLYHASAEFFAFATEYNGLFAADGVPRRVNEDELARRLLMSTERVEGELIYDAIKVLPGGTTLKIEADGAIALRRYWTPHAGVEHAGKDEATLINSYRDTIIEAVACRVRRLIAPPTLLFSGGFDSGIIAAIAGPMVAESGGVLTCAASVLPADDPRRSARAAVEAFRGMSGLDIRYFVRGAVTAYDNLEEGFATTGRLNAPSIARRGLGAIARRAGSRLAIDGHGGDYTVNPYDAAMLGAMLRRGQVRRFVSEYAARMRFTGWSARRVFGRDVMSALVPVAVRTAWRRAVNGFKPAWRRRGVALAFAKRKLASGVVNGRRLLDGHIPGPRWQDRWRDIAERVSRSATGSNYGFGVADLDLTRPFHDKRIVELGLAIPDTLQFRDGRERWLARRAFADQLPSALVERLPGNDHEQPDLLRMTVEAAPAMLSEICKIENRECVQRYIDLEAVEKMVSRPGSEHSTRDTVEFYYAMKTLTAARFIAWLDRSNR